MISYKLMKYRAKRSPDAPDYFSHPFVEGNTMKLKPDLNLAKSLSIMEMGNGMEKFDPVQNRKDRAAKEGRNVTGGRVTANRKSLLEDDDDNEDDE